MNNPINTNAIAYSGKVKILYQDAKGKYRTARFSNEGKLPLFTFLTYALQGTYVRDLVPKYLNGLYVDGDVESPAFVQKVMLTKTPVRKNSENPSDINSLLSDCIEYCFTINPGILIKNSNITAVNRLQLLNAKAEVCAEIDLEDSDCIQVGAGSTANIMVYWTLQFKNTVAGQSADIINTLVLTFLQGQSTVKHFTDRSPILLRWSVNQDISNIKNNFMYCGETRCSAVTAGGSGPVEYSCNWTPSAPTAEENVAGNQVLTRSIKVGVGPDAANLKVTKSATCKYTHYVYCGFSSQEIGAIQQSDITGEGTHFQAKVQSSGTLSEFEYEGASASNPSYLYYLIPSSYIDTDAQKVVMIFPGLGTADIDANPREINLEYTVNGQPVSVPYWIYRITEYLQTGNLKISIEIQNK